MWGFLVAMSGALHTQLGADLTNAELFVVVVTSHLGKVSKNGSFSFLGKHSKQLYLWQKLLMGLYQFPFDGCIFFLYSGV